MLVGIPTSGRRIAGGSPGGGSSREARPQVNSRRWSWSWGGTPEKTPHHICCTHPRCLTLMRCTESGHSLGLFRALQARCSGASMRGVAQPSECLGLRAALSRHVRLQASTCGAGKPARMQRVELAAPRITATLQSPPDERRHCLTPGRGVQWRRDKPHMQVSACARQHGSSMAAGKMKVVAGMDRNRGSQTVEPMADRESLTFPTKLLTLPTTPALEPGGGAYAEAACRCKHFQQSANVLGLGHCTSQSDCVSDANPCGHQRLCSVIG